MIKFFHRHLRRRFEKYYFKNHWHLVLDLSLIIVIICLLASLVVLYFWRPNFPGLGFYAHNPVDLDNPPLNLALFAPDEAIDIRDGVVLKLAYRNAGTAVISDLKLSLETADNNFSITRLEASGDTSIYTIDGQNLNFSKIGAGAGGETEVKVYFSTENGDRVINWRARSEYTIGRQLLKKDFDLLSLKVKADLNVKDMAYYTSPQGDQLGIGPVPPIVGIPTNYWIFFDARSLADWKDVAVSARLPKGVELTGNRSLLAGDFKYYDDSRQLIWKISDLAGREESYHLGFEVQLVPVDNQIGEVLPLLNSLQYLATDALTGADISGSLAVPTTDLSDDRFNSGRGTVEGQ